jgi:hypothetical protein
MRHEKNIEIEKITTISEFPQSLNPILLLQCSSEFFFTKYDQNIDMKNVQELNFCPKNYQIMGVSNKPKKHTVYCRIKNNPENVNTTPHFTRYLSIFIIDKR